MSCSPKREATLHSSPRAVFVDGSRANSVSPLPLTSAPPFFRASCCWVLFVAGFPRLTSAAPPTATSPPHMFTRAAIYAGPPAGTALGWACTTFATTRPLRGSKTMRQAKEPRGSRSHLPSFQVADPFSFGCNDAPSSRRDKRPPHLRAHLWALGTALKVFAGKSRPSRIFGSTLDGIRLEKNEEASAVNPMHKRREWVWEGD